MYDQLNISIKNGGKMEELIELAKKGNEDAFTQIIMMIEKDLYKIARMRFFSEDDICEVVQETIIEAFKNLKKVRKNEYFKTWVIKILINKCNKLYKSKCKRQNFIEWNDTNITNIYSKNTDEEVIDKLDFEILINDLSYNEKIALILYYMENLTTKQISKILREPESTIRNRISRAKIKLKKKLLNRGEKVWKN